jgi:histidinol-phosphate aminotransferase
MSGITDLVRADLRDFAGYRSARSDRVDGDVWLNANESPYANVADPCAVSRRYPDPQPDALRKRLAWLYGCRPEQLIAGRGSDEAIDLLVRALCAPGQGAIVTTPPTFGMYAVSARLHGVRVVEAPLVEDGDTFRCDVEAVVRGALKAEARLVFLCSPGNPTGQSIPLAVVDDIAARLRGRAIVVVDEAYQEYASQASATTLLDGRDNVVVLRTLSKAHALAGARLGVAIGDADLITVLRRCQAPYPLPAPSIDLVLRALSPEAVEHTRAGVGMVLGERERLRAALRRCPGVSRVYASDANFVLARFDDAPSVYRRLLAQGVVVRDVSSQPKLRDALRITVGRDQEIDRVLAAFAKAEAAA